MPQLCGTHNIGSRLTKLKLFNLGLQKYLSYERRLAQLNIDSMQARKVKADLIMC